MEYALKNKKKSKKRQINFKVSEEVYQKIIQNAQKHSDGNKTRWITFASLNCNPSK